MREIQHIRRTADAAPPIPSLLSLFNFAPVETLIEQKNEDGTTARRRLMSNGRPTDEIMRKLTRLFGKNEFDATSAALKLGCPRQSIADVLRHAAKLGLMTTHVTKPLGTIYYRIAS